MQRFRCTRVSTVSVIALLLATPGLARVPRPAAVAKDVLKGQARVDAAVAAIAARCQCAPTARAALAAADAVPAVHVGTASGAAGQQVSFSVSLSTAGLDVAGVQDDIAFDSINTPVVRVGSGRPDCTVNPDIDKNATAFAFQPPGCSGSACTAFRALVLSFSNVDPIPDGSVMYTCNVDIAARAAPGSYPLVVSNVGMSTPDGQAIESVGTDGEIIVTGGSATPTPTATPVPTGIGPPTSKDQCKKGGWKIFTVPRTFKNQGDCIQFVNTGK